MTTEERKKYLHLYNDAAHLLHNTIKNFPKEMWKYKPSEKQWSIHEIIVHIADSECNSFIRCRCFIAEPGKTVMAYDQDAWAVKLNYHNQSAEESLALFTLLRHSSQKLIAFLPDETWSNLINHPENGVMTMDEWLKIYAEHIPVHIRQMERVFEAWKEK